MKPFAKPLLWAGGLVAIGVLVVVLLQRNPSVDDTPQPPVASSATVSAQAATTAPTAAAQESAPPWMNNAGGTAASAVAAQSTQQATPYFNGRQPSREELNRALVQIRERAVQNDRAADELLRQLDTLQAAGKLPPNINAPALRANILVAKRSQALARELGDLMAVEQNEGTRQRMNAIIGELQQLQKQLRYDVNTGATAPTAAVTATPNAGRQ